MNASGTIFLTISAVIYTILITIIFIRKKKENKIENKESEIQIIENKNEIKKENIKEFTNGLNKDFREELRNSEYTEKTNEVSKEYALQMANGEPMKNTDDRGRDS